jgi:outer membrane protein TolC
MTRPTFPVDPCRASLRGLGAQAARARAATPRALRRGAAALAAAMLAGCVGFSPDGGFGSVEQTARERLGRDLAWARSDADRELLARRVAELLARPLSVDDAVQVALLNNRGLQAAYQELGISEAQLVESGRLPNPHFSMMRASRSVDGVRDYKIEQALTFNVFALLTMPQALEIERRRFEQTQRTVSMEMLRLAADTRRAYYRAVAGEETVRYMRQVAQAADAGAELARRMAQAGNFNRLQQAREQGFHADAALALARAERVARSDRERLVRLMGLWGAQTAFALPARLPELPGEPRDLPDVERIAMSQRLDIAAARIETEALARNLGLTKTTRFVNVLELGPARVLEGERGDAYKTGYEISLELPLFDFGSARVARAEAIYLRQLDRVAQAAVDARSEVRDAYDGYRSGFDVARHYRDEIVPLRKRVSDENLLRYNGMLIGVFELLADARSQIAAVNGYIEALRDFWVAQADLEMALLGRAGLSAPVGPGPASAPTGAGH